ncbi:YnbE family lipoprotein [Tsuneonella suprasediminis]|uniref:YnbE family lipoprotein n=1 Tax=Tsuneonella suprasediminis TaxID=2306996 RepID=UPI002F94494D
MICAQSIHEYLSPNDSSVERDKLLGGMGRTVLMAMVGSAALAGCISVKAPDKPIVIELNINIRQEVIYRLAADANNTIDENEDIF